MKRPLAVAGISLFITLLVSGAVLDTAFLLYFEIVFSAALIISLAFKKTRQNMTLPTFFAVAVVACLLFLCFENTYYRTLSFCGTRRNVEATVTEYPEFKKEYGRFYCVADILSIDGEKTKGNIRLSFSESKDEIDSSSLYPGCKIAFDGYVYKIGQDKTEIVQYFKSQSIYIGAYSIKNLSITERKIKPFRYYSGILKNNIAKKLSFDFDDDVAGVIFSLLTGSKDYLKDEIYQDFQRSGIAHIMAVSGLHLSIAVILMKALLERFRKITPIIKSCFLIVLVLFVMTLADFSGSVKRAGIMMLLYIISDFFFAKSDSLNNLGFAALAILLMNPYAAFDVSLMLSFLCTLSIICIAVPIISITESKFTLLRKSAAIKAAFSSIIISISVMIFTSSVTLLYFGNISLLSPLTNLLAVPAVPFIIAFAVFHLIFGNIISFVSVPLCKIFSYYTLFIADIFSDFRLCCITPQTNTQRNLIILVSSAVSLIVFFSVKALIKRRKKFSSRF